jgi:membrane dipeptidase
MIIKILFSLPIALIFAGTILAQRMPAGADPKLWQRALQIHKKAIVVDTHNDITSPMYDEDFDLATSSVGKFHKFGGDPFHTDINRLKAGGISAEFFSIYVAPEFVAKDGGATARAMNLIDAVYRAAEQNPDKMIMAYTANDIRNAKRAGKIAALMGIEGGHAIGNSLATLREFYRLGVRYMTLTWNNTNDWADAARGEQRHNGLSDFGKDVVREMNRLGMLVDVSHVSDKTMSDVLDVSTAPVLVSHSSVKFFSPHPRNVNDDLIKRIAKNGGVIDINFYTAFLDNRNWQEGKDRDARLKKELEQINEQFKSDETARSEAIRKLYAANPIYKPAYTKIVDHIDYIKKLVGIDYVGVGSDFDGVPDLPEGMNGAEDLPLVTYEMLRRGYTETEIRKVLGENFLRVFQTAERVARIESRKISGDGSLKKIAK